MQLKFLESLVTKVKTRGDNTRASRVTEINQKEAIRKQWRQINRSTRKACSSLTVAVNVPTAKGGQNKYKTKEGVFKAVIPILLEWFQLELVAQCHRGTFFKDVGHLVNRPVAQKILDSIYEYPLDLDPATRLLLEEALATFTALSPTKTATNVTPKDFQHFWRTARERTGLSYSGLHFNLYIATSCCPYLLLLHMAKLLICARNGMPLA